MIDLMSIVIGILIGSSVGFILGHMRSVTIVNQLKFENERLSEEYHRLTDRDARGRFKGGK